MQNAILTKHQLFHVTRSTIRQHTNIQYAKEPTGHCKQRSSSLDDKKNSISQLTVNSHLPNCKDINKSHNIYPNLKCTHKAYIFSAIV